VSSLLEHSAVICGTGARRARARATIRQKYDLQSDYALGKVH